MCNSPEGDAFRSGSEYARVPVRFPSYSKGIGVPLAKTCCQVMTGKSLHEIEFQRGNRAEAFLGEGSMCSPSALEGLDISRESVR